MGQTMQNLKISHNRQKLPKIYLQYNYLKMLDNKQAFNAFRHQYITKKFKTLEY